MRDIVTGNEGLNIMLNEIVNHEMDKTLNEMISVIKEWQKSTEVVYPETIIDLIKSKISNKESTPIPATPAQGLDISKIWIFEIQDAICGGIIIADSEEEALKKLALDRKLEPSVVKCSTVLFPLNSLDLNKHVHDLW